MKKANSTTPKLVIMKNHKIIKNIHRKISQHKALLLIGPMKLETPYYPKTLPIVYIDGGIKHEKKQSRHPHLLSLGDGDSAKRLLDLQVSSHKDYSDLKFALDILPRFNGHLYLNGLFPAIKNEKRWDHLLANLGECFEVSQKKKVTIHLNSKSIILPPGGYDVTIEGLFSLFSLSKTQIKLAGECKYQIKKFKLITPFSSFGLSNESIRNGKIRLEIKGPIMILAQRKQNFFKV